MSVLFALPMVSSFRGGRYRAVSEAGTAPTEKEFNLLTYATMYFVGENKALFAPVILTSSSPSSP
jgi:hypothetical protein